MARRSSARLRSQNSTTPKRVSLSHDAPIARTPRTVPARLASLQESDEMMPGAFPQSASPKSTFALNPVIPKTMADVATPTKAAPIQPAAHEMHPQLHHQSTAKPRDEARHLGFSNMAPHTEPPKPASRIAALQATPSKARNPEEDVKQSPSYQFTFRREHSLELSPEAKKLMHEKREEAARIREQMIADGEGLPSIDEVLATRKIAKPKGRFSQVHTKEFEKMDSIASHPSAVRQKLAAAQAGHAQTPQKPLVSPSKSLKRSPSKAGLDQSSTPSRPTSRDEAKPLPAIPGSQLPRTTSIKGLRKATNAQPAPSAKRAKRAETDDVSAYRPESNDGEKPLPATPQASKQLLRSPSKPNLGGLATPTQASLARAASIKSIKTTKIPAPSFTPAKATAPSAHKQADVSDVNHAASPALLARSPSKPSFFSKPSGMSIASGLLARSPFKSGVSKKAPETTEGSDAGTRIKAPPLLSRSPLKGAVTKSAESESAATAKAPAIPFLARSPTKIPMMPTADDTAESPGKSTSNKLLGRFNLLRQSPVKSILRSPQRLYSDDPAKVAAGTHLATPEKYVAGKGRSSSAIPSSTAGNKRVDFTASTKARDEKAHGSTPSTTPTPSPSVVRMQDAEAEPESISYPDLPVDTALLSPSPQKRRQTSGPKDFTFRAGDQDIVFGRSPNTAASTESTNRRSTIRMVTSDLVPSPAPVVGSKKRKFEFENKATAAEADDVVSEKENTPVIEEEEERPAKRARPSTAATPAKNAAAAASNAKATTTTRRTTLGVKPKGAKTVSPVKRSSTISQARLAALSQPKRRG